MTITLKAIAVIGILLLFVGFAGSSSEAASESESEIVIGALLPLTGSHSSSGESTQAALEIAVRDINEYLSDVNSTVTVELIVRDKKTDPEVALEKLRNLSEMGIRIVIGPDSSAEVEAVKAYADENDILVISPSSTAISLAIPGDNVFHFVPDDTHQAEAIARLMWEDGVRAVIPIWRGDIWGDDLANATKGKFEELGGTVVDGVRYSPTTEVFSTELGSLNSKVSQAIAQ